MHISLTSLHKTLQSKDITTSTNNAPLLIPVVNKAALTHLERFSSLVVLQQRYRCARSYLLYEPRQVLELLWSIKDAMHDDDWFIAVHANTCDHQQQQQQHRAMRPCGYPWTLHLRPDTGEKQCGGL